MTTASDFWSRRRAGVAAEAESEAAEQALVAREEAVADKTDAEILEELDLPDPDTLQKGDDFQAFMAKAVPDRIRRRALRKLWISNPVLANIDELVDYGEDFTDAALAVENIQTAYQVGKGMLKHVEEMARQAEEAERLAQNGAGEEVGEKDAEDAPSETLVVEGEGEADMQNDAEIHVAERGEMQEGEAPLLPRRMKFVIEETTA